MPKRNKTQSHSRVPKRRSTDTRLDIPRSLRIFDDVYTCVQTQEALVAATSSAGGTTFTAYGINLSGFAQSAALIGLFDYYRLIEAEYTFLPRVTTNVGDPNTFVANLNLGLFHSVVDTNDVNILTSIADALNYPSCKVWSAGADQALLRHRFVPKVLVGAALLVDDRPTNSWYSTAAPGTTWCGVKTCWSTTSNVFSMDLTIRVKMQFRNLR